MKVQSAGLVLCLNIGVAPPDVVHAHPCARKECWLDPMLMTQNKAIEVIANRLQEQFLRWQPKLKCKQSHDPSPDAIKRLGGSLRRRAKDEFALFYYNGHGVPQPTPQAELWFYNTNFTQYLPVTLPDLLSWVGSPTFFILDCASSETVLTAFAALAEARRVEASRMPTNGRGTAAPAVELLDDCIWLGASSRGELLPANPELPADLFTACLTTPVETALLWIFVTRRNTLLPRVTEEMLQHIPGVTTDRRTMRGHMHWLLTAVTDSIAWATLPTSTFLRYFRNDILIAGLMRNFLLAQRIMRSVNCTPVSIPALPPTHTHPLWLAWDMAVDHCLSQLPAILAGRAEFEPALFFTDQLLAFEVWLNMHPNGGQLTLVSPSALPQALAAAAAAAAATAAAAASVPAPPTPLSPAPTLSSVSLNTSTLSLTSTGAATALSTAPSATALPAPAPPAPSGPPAPPAQPTVLAAPEQLPVVLQVLLSQQHRLRALELLDRFVLLGPSAVHQALSVGIFPYIFKLLGSPAPDLRPVLVSIWATILSVDVECRRDLMKPPAAALSKTAPTPEKGFVYFLRALQNQKLTPATRAKAAFVLSVFCHNNDKGQELCFEAGLVQTCVELLTNPDATLRHWAAVAFAKCCVGLEHARALALELRAPRLLAGLLSDLSYKVRASALAALASLVGLQKPIQLRRNVQLEEIAMGRVDREINLDMIALSMLEVAEDASHIVRAELVAALCPVITLYQEQFTESARHFRESNVTAAPDSLLRVVKALVTLATDPQPELAQTATTLLDSIHVHVGRQPEPARPLMSPVHSRRTSLMTPSKFMPVPPRIAEPILPSNSFESCSIPAWMIVTSTPRRADSGSEAPDPTEAEASIQALMAYFNELADQLEMAEEAGTAEVSMRDLQTSVRTRVREALHCYASLPRIDELRATLDALGWDGVEFTTGLSVLAFQQIAEALKPFAPRGKYGRDLYSIQTGFFAWCCSTVSGWSRGARTPAALADEKDWYHERNTRVFDELDLTRDRNPRLDETSFQTPVREVANVAALHAYEPQLVLASSSGNVTVHAIDSTTELTSFSVGLRPNHRVTALKLVNEHERALLAVGSSDGVVRLWQNFDHTPSILTSWRAVSKLHEVRDGPGLVMDWHQGNGHLFASGETKSISVWDARSLRKTAHLPTGVLSCVTSLCVDSTQGSIVAAGFGSGGIRVYDARLTAEQSLVQQFNQHDTWVLGAFLNREGANSLVSAARNGSILWWDQRYPGAPVRSLLAYNFRKEEDSMLSFDVHPRLSLMATASYKQSIKILNHDGEQLFHHRHHTSFMGEHIAPTTSLLFHPLRPMLVSGTIDKILTIFTQNQK